MYLSKKISVNIPESHLGYLFLYAKRYTAAYRYAFRFFFKLFRKFSIKSIPKEKKKRIMRAIHSKEFSNLAKFIAKKYNLTAIMARKSVQDGYRDAMIRVVQNKKSFKNIVIRYQLSATGVRSPGFKLDPENNLLIISYKLPIVKNGRVVWGYKRAEIQLRIRRKTKEIIKLAYQKKFKMAARLIFLNQSKAYLVLSIDYPDPTRLPITHNYKSLAFDINYDRITASLVKQDGNPVYFKTIRIRDIKDKSRLERINIISQAIEGIFRELEYEKFFVVLENLDGLRKKYDHRKHRTIVAYRLFQRLIINKCARKGIPVRIVEPSFSSVIGFKKYKEVYRGRSTHELAAFVLARRGLSFIEKLPISVSKFKTYKNAAMRGFVQFVKK